MMTLFAIFISIKRAPIGSEQVFFIIASLSFLLEGFLSVGSLYLGNNFGSSMQSIGEIDSKHELIVTPA